MPAEILAGATLAALAIPEVMGYARIAGMPVITGLYTMLIPVCLFALFGSSRHLVVGADSATAAMLAAGLAGFAVAESAEYVALACMLALLAAAFLLFARVFRLGFLANFLSRTALVGFLSGVGVQVALGQVPGMLGLPATAAGSWGQVLTEWRIPGGVHPWTLAVSAVVIAGIVGSRWISRRIPGPLIAIIGTTALSRVLDLRSRGVDILGEIPSGLPALGLPDINWSYTLAADLLPLAFGMFVVIIAQSAATARAYAYRYEESLNEDEDLVGLSLANLGAAMSGAFVVNGSPTKTQMVDTAGGKSQLAQIAAAIVVLLVVLFFTGPLAYMPRAVLSAVVFLIGIQLIDLKGMRRIYAERRWEFWVASITAVIVVLWGVEQGILLAIVLSLVAHTRHGYRPNNSVLVRTEAGKLLAHPTSRPGQVMPGLLIYRFSHSMYYANSAQLSDEVHTLVEEAGPSLRWFCIDCIAVDDIDFSAAQVLRSIFGHLSEREVRPVLATVSEHVRRELDRSGLSQRLGTEGYYDTIEDVIDDFGERSGQAR